MHTGRTRHSLEDHTWYIQQNTSTSTHTKHVHNIQQQNNNHTQSYCELFHQRIHKHWQTLTNTGKHATHKTNISINRSTHKTQGYNITLTTTRVQEAIKQSKNSKSQGTDKLNIGHLKLMGLRGLAFLTSMLKTALNTNIIPHIWKLANIVPIPKPKQRHRQGRLIYAHIHTLSNCKDTSSLHNSKHTKHTHATRVPYTTHSNGTTHSKQHRSKGVQPNGSP